MKQEAEILAVYEGFKKDFPKAMTPEREALFVASGDRLRTMLDSFLRPQLSRGLSLLCPPLCLSLYLSSYYLPPSPFLFFVLLLLPSP